MIPSTEALNTQQMHLLSITKKLHFPAKLFFILEFIDLYAPHLKSLFSWKHHGRCFHISDKKSFEQNIMTLFFNSAKYDTFRRQLNIWGFTRIVKVRSTDIGCYFHAKFLRGQFELCNTMVRSRASEFMKMPGNQPDFEEMPIMPATVTLSIPHFAGMAQNLSSSLYEPKDDHGSNCNASVPVSSDKKRKHGMEDVFQSHDSINAGLYSSLVDSSFYPAPLPEEPPISSIITDLPRFPLTHLSNDTCNISNDPQYTFSDQTVVPSRKYRKVSIDNKSVVFNFTEDNDLFKDFATPSCNVPNQDLMISAIDAMPIGKSLALAQFFFNQQQVEDFNSMNMLPFAKTSTSTTCPSTLKYHHNSNQDTEVQESKENLASKHTSLLHASSSASTFKKSSDILSKELVSCNSLLSISADTDFTEMKNFLLDESNQAWFEESLSF